MLLSKKYRDYIKFRHIYSTKIRKKTNVIDPKKNQYSHHTLSDKTGGRYRVIIHYDNRTNYNFQLMPNRFLINHTEGDVKLSLGETSRSGENGGGGGARGEGGRGVVRGGAGRGEEGSR